MAALAPNENVVRAGGWGPILGDEGSGWRLAQAFLQSFCWWIDRGRDAESTPEGLQVLNSFLAEKQMPIVPEKLNSSLIALAADRHQAAQLAPAILELATQPNCAATLQLVNHQTALLVDQIQQVHRRLAIADHEWRLCLAGGLASNDKRFQHFLKAELTRRAIEPTSVVVIDPLGAALRFASQLS